MRLTDLFLLSAIIVAVPGVTLLASGELEPQVTTPAAVVTAAVEAELPVGNVLRLTD